MKGKSHMKFTKEEFARFRDDCNKALAPLGKSYNLAIHAGSVSYADSKFTLRLECEKTDAGDLRKQEFEKHCELYGLSAEDYRRELTFDGTRYMLVGFSPSSPKYPIICRRVDSGKEYKLTEESVKQAMKK